MSRMGEAYINLLNLGRQKSGPLSKKERWAEVVITGKPEGKGRAISGRVTTKAGRAFVTHRTPRKTMTYEAVIRSAFSSGYPDWQALPESYVFLSVDALYPPPKKIIARRASLIKRLEAMKAKELSTGKAVWKTGEVEAIERELTFQRYCPVRPDWDNVGKIVCDALNGVAWPDDARVVDAHVEKFYALDGEAPCLRIRIVERHI